MDQPTTGGMPLAPESGSVLPFLDLLYQGFLSVAEFRDPETGAHLERMALFSRLLAEAAAGQAPFRCAADPAWQETLFHAAPIHDIGKIAVPDRILLKPGKLTHSEFEIMKAHTTYGQALLEGMSRRFAGEVPAVIRMGTVVAEAHHERWDGAGYPRGLAGEDIPLAARIVAIADVYDAVTSPRVYRPDRFSHEEAVALIADNGGQMFDPGLVEAFLAVAERARQEAERLADPPLAPSAEAGPPPQPRPLASILVVDDEPFIRDLLQEILRREGWQVRAAASVNEARLLLAQQTFDLLTLDINMPGESGLVLLGELAPCKPDTLVIMMTAMMDVRVGVESLKQGAHDYLVKPVDLEELLLAVRRALYHRELEMENRAYLTRLELTVAHRTRELNKQLQAAQAELACLRQRPRPPQGQG